MKNQVFETSRYADEFLHDRTTVDGEVRTCLTFRKIDREISNKGIQIISQEGDRLDIYSNDYYGNPDYWYVIADKNPHIIEPLNIEGGLVVNIPPIGDVV